MRREPAPAIRPRRRRAAAFTLVEMAVTLVVMSVLMTAIGSVVVLASRALPHNEPAAASAAAVGLAADQIAGELRYAKGVTVASTTTLEFTVPDRNGDNLPETIRYDWSGVPGAPLTRRYNGGDPVELIPAVQSVAFGYDRKKITTERTVTVTNDSGEVLFAEGTGLGLLASAALTPVSATTWVSQAFTIDRVSIPSTATRVEIKRVGLKLKRPLSGGPSLTVAIHPRATAGAPEPATSPVGTPVVIAAADLTTSFATMDIRLNGAVLPTASTRDLTIMVKGSGTSSAQVQYQTYSLAAADAPVYLWTTDSGATWQPSASTRNRNDAVFYVYGSYQWTSTTQVNDESYTLNAATVALATSGGRADTLVRTLNSPQVPAP